MANDVINPYQTFRDKKGVPLAGGSLRVLVNRTNQLGTAFSDSALTVSQTVDGYRLDNFGRVRADLRWSGLRTVEQYDRNDVFIRSVDDVVTAVDTSTFAINLASVAAMVAETSLVVGDVVETQSYNAGQDEGGARYLIVAAATGTDDGYTYHDLTNGLQAELIDLEANKNFYVAGAVGDGVADDSVPCQAVLSIGGDIECANGTFLVDALTLSVAARIYGDGILRHVGFTTTDMLTLSGANLFIQFDGVEIDGNSDNQTSEAAISSIRSTVTATAGNVSVISFNQVTFSNGAERDVEGIGDDTGNGVLYAFGTCDFLGGLEGTDTPFLPAHASFADGANAIFEDCYFDLNADPAVVGGRCGVLMDSTTAPTNPGYLSVGSCTFNRIGVTVDGSNILAAVHARDCKQLIVNDNRFLSPHGGAVVFGAEVNTVKITENMATGLTGTNKLSAIGSLTTTNASPGDNWDISGNELIDIAGIAISIDGSSAGVDASNVSITNNIIDSPTGVAILVHDIDTLTIDENEIDMALVDAVNAIQINTNGVSGQVGIEGNTIINVGTASGKAIENAVASTASFTVDGNTIENCVDGIDIQNTTNAYVTNNTLEDISGDLITLGTLTNGTIEGNSYTGAAPTTFAQNAGSITNLIVGENLWSQLDNSITQIASATTISISAHYHTLTGTTTVQTINMPFAVAGWVLVLQTASLAVVINELGNIRLGATTRTLGDTSDTLTLVFDGTNWNEVAFSNN